MRHTREAILETIYNDNLELFQYRTRYIKEITLKTEILSECLMHNRFELFSYYFKKRVKITEKFVCLKHIEVIIKAFDIFGPDSAFQSQAAPFKQFIQNQLRIVKLKKLLDQTVQ